MFDFDPDQTRSRLQRARGRAEVGFSLRGGRTRLDHLHQSGCAKALLPTVAGAPEVVFLNTAGGLTGGDRLDYNLAVGAGGRVTATTQTAERGYASPGGAAAVDCRMSAGRGARLDWLPQETILFDRSALRRRTVIDLAGDAELLFCETLVLGRAAMGERLESLWFEDRREVWRDGTPVMIEPVRLDDRVLARRGSPALLHGARALAMVGFFAPGAEDALGGVRAVLPADHGVVAVASAWNGRCLVRLSADDAWPLRRVMLRVLEYFRGAAPPRVWQI